MKALMELVRNQVFSEYLDFCFAAGISISPMKVSISMSRIFRPFCWVPMQPCHHPFEAPIGRNQQPYSPQTKPGPNSDSVRTHYNTCHPGEKKEPEQLLTEEFGELMLVEWDGIESCLCDLAKVYVDDLEQRLDLLVNAMRGSILKMVDHMHLEKKLNLSR